MDCLLEEVLLFLSSCFFLTIWEAPGPFWGALGVISEQKCKTNARRAHESTVFTLRAAVYQPKRDRKLTLGIFALVRGRTKKPCAFPHCRFRRHLQSIHRRRHDVARSLASQKGKAARLVAEWERARDILAERVRGKRPQVARRFEPV